MALSCAAGEAKFAPLLPMKVKLNANAVVCGVTALLSGSAPSHSTILSLTAAELRPTSTPSEPPPKPERK